MRSGLLPVALTLALLAACTTAPAPAPRSFTPEQRAAAAQVLFWDQATRDANFRRMDQLFPVNVIRAGGEVRPLPPGAPIAIPDADVDAFMARQNIAGLILVEDGKVRLERYARGFAPDQRWTSFSVAKSLTSILVGAAVRDGHIESLDDPVTRYVPELAGSAYDGVSVRHVLTMSSGVRWNEDYRDPQSDVAKMFTTVPPPGVDQTVAYLKTLPRAHAPGSRWNYNTAETNLIGVIVSRAVGKPLADFASEQLWRPYGMEADAYWQVNELGQEVSGCCISATLRDYARIGQFMLDGGVADGRPVLPGGWIADATRAHHQVSPRGDGYGYQWWTLPGGFRASGIFGQSIRVDPARRRVMVTLSAWPRATDPALSADREAFFQRAAAGDRADQAN